MNYWNKCLVYLESELSSVEFNTWIRPLQAEEFADSIQLYAPNRFVLDWVRNHYIEVINVFIVKNCDSNPPKISIDIGSFKKETKTQNRHSTREYRHSPRSKEMAIPTNLNATFNFDTFVEGKSNQIARAASLQIAQNPGNTYNPLFIYGGVGLGKTHLMHAIGNMIIKNNPDNHRVVYLRSEQFVAEMVKALQHNTIDDFKRRYRSVNALLIDDIQFFVGKDRSQEEFFHTFNALLESQQQIILSSDRFPKEVKGLEERLKSRFGWGLTVAVDPPDLETRVAILQSKALQLKAELPSEVAFFIGKRIQSNIRELEGALKRVIANATFTAQSITLVSAKEALRDMLAVQDRLVSIDNIQKIVAEYFQIRTSELLSPKRSRSIARPRQIAMTLAKELTTHSLPEIGEAFGGRDHTTVLHANRKVAELRKQEQRIDEDYTNLLRILGT